MWFCICCQKAEDAFHLFTLESFSSVFLQLSLKLSWSQTLVPPEVLYKLKKNSLILGPNYDAGRTHTYVNITAIFTQSIRIMTHLSIDLVFILVVKILYYVISYYS